MASKPDRSTKEMQAPLFFMTTAFERVQAKWYDKLKRDGFQDIENTRLPSRPLIQYHSFKINGKKACYSETNMSASRSYYEAATRIVQEDRFKSALQKRIWTRHSEGQTVREIAEALKIDKSSVQIMIDEVRGRNGIQKYRG